MITIKEGDVLEVRVVKYDFNRTDQITISFAGEKRGCAVEILSHTLAPEPLKVGDRVTAYHGRGEVTAVGRYHALVLWDGSGAETSYDLTTLKKDIP